MDRSDWAPSPADIGSILRVRTKDRFGNEPGTFNSVTRPTADEVSDHIDTIVAEINAECGPIPDDIQDNARRTAAYGAAAEVELTFWPEQGGNGRSSYDRLYARYQTMFARLKVQVAEISTGGSPNDADELPIFSFPDLDPCDPNAFVGWQTRW